MDSILYSQQINSSIKNRQFEHLRSILIKYLKDHMENYNQDLSKLPIKNIQITYNNRIHRSKIFSYRNDIELVYKIIDNMFSDIKFLLFYDWDMDIDIITNLINILINNDSLTISKKIIDII